MPGLNLTQICGSSDDQNGKPNDTENFVTGVLVALLGSTGEQLGLSLWKLAEMRVQKRDAELRANKLAKSTRARKLSSIIQRVGSADEAEENESSVKEKTGSIYMQEPMNEVCTSCAPVIEIDESETANRIEILVNDATDSDGPVISAPDDSFESRVPSLKDILSTDSSPKPPHSPHPSAAGLDISLESEHGSDWSADGDAGGGGPGGGGLRAWCVRHEAPLSFLAVIVFAGGNGLNFVALGLIQARPPLPPREIERDGRTRPSPRGAPRAVGRAAGVRRDGGAQDRRGAGKP